MRFLTILFLLAFTTISHATEPADTYTMALEAYQKGFYGLVRPGERPRDQLLIARTLFTQIMTNFPSTNEGKLSQMRVGFCSYKLGDLPNAIQALSTYILANDTSDNPLIDDAKLQLGLSYKLSNMPNEAETWIATVIGYKANTNEKLKNLLPDAYYELWDLFIKVNNPEKASQTFTEFQGSYPNHPKVIYINKYYSSINQ